MQLEVQLNIKNTKYTFKINIIYREINLSFIQNSIKGENKK